MYNRVTLIGRLGADPRVIVTAAGTTIKGLSLATARSRKVGEAWEEVTEWHRVSLFDLAADRFSGAKGDLVLVEGSIHYGEYIDKDGIKRYTTQINADRTRIVQRADRGERRHAGAPQDRGGDQGGSNQGGDDGIPF